MNKAEFTLDQAPIGHSVRVVEVAGDDAIARRLADLGVRSGVLVACLRRAPLGDPSVFELCGYQLCLRRTETARVRVTDAGMDAGVEAGVDAGIEAGIKAGVEADVDSKNHREETA